MNIEEFWTLIDKTREASNGNISRQAELLAETLAQLPVEQILAFETIMYDLMDNAYDAALWDAAYIIGCGCGDSGFSDFRAWLITQGQNVYHNALANPESLVNLIELNEDAQEGDLLYVVMNAYEQKTGHEIPVDPSRFRPHPTLRGTHWPDKNKEGRFPILSAKFGDCQKKWSLIH